MVLSFAERNYSQEGLEAVPLAPERPTGIRPAYLRIPPDGTAFSAEPTPTPTGTGKQSHLEKGSFQDSSPPSHPRLFCGVPASTILFAIIAIIAIATAAILGGILGTRSASCPPVNYTPTTPNSTTSTSSPTTSPAAFTTSETVPLACPSLQDQTKAYTPASGPSSSFRFMCSNDCPSNDLVAIWSYSIDMCLDACVSFTQLNSTGLSCGAVSFRSVLGNSSVFGGNCFLKTGCPGPRVMDFGDSVASAVLVT